MMLCLKEDLVKNYMNGLIDSKDFFMDSHGKAVVEGDVIYCSTGDKGVVAMDKDTFDVLRFYFINPAHWGSFFSSLATSPAMTWAPWALKWLLSS